MRLALLFSCCAIALLASGCGGSKPSPKRAYDRKMLAVARRYSGQFKRSTAHLFTAHHQSRAAAGKAEHTLLRDQARSFAEDAAAFARIKPPADARKDHLIIVQSYRAAARQFEALEANNGKPEDPAAFDISWQTNLDAAIGQLRREGYALGNLEAAVPHAVINTFSPKKH